MITEEELNKKISKGEVEDVSKEDTQKKALPVATEENEVKFLQPTLEDYESFLNLLKKLKQHGTAAPTYTPKSFIEQFYWRIQGSGSTNSLYINFNNSWHRFFSGEHTALTSCETVAPKPTWVESWTTLNLNTNTNGYVGMFELPFAITVNKISIRVTAVVDSQAVHLGIFSEDGQTRHISVTTAAPTGAETLTTSVPSVELPAGMYYLVAVPDDSCDITVRSFTMGLPMVEMQDQIASEPRLCGTITVTASTMPSTFDPVADITGADDSLLVFRLDN